MSLSAQIVNAANFARVKAFSHERAIYRYRKP